MTTTATAFQEAQKRRMTVQTVGAITLSEGGKAAEVGSITVSDTDLIAQARSGSQSALESLYTRHEAAVFRLAYRVLGSADDADDVRQETFVRAFNSLSKYRQDAAFKTYALTICSNLCRDRMRAKKRRPEVSYGLTPAEESSGMTWGSDPAKQMDRHLDMARVRSALDRLSPSYREILHLRHVEELSVDEVARVIGCSRFAAPVRLFRARKAFQEAYLALVRQEDRE